MAFSEDLTDLLTTGLKLRFHDCFLSPGPWSSAVTQTGAVTYALSLLRADTGIQQGSVARPYYTRNVFNPLYGKLRIKLRLNDPSSAFFFMGFKYGAGAPAWHMAESHAGIMLYNGTLYLSTGNGDPSAPHYELTAIPSCDLTLWHVFELEGSSMRFYSLPYSVPYFDKNVLPGLKQGMVRKWSPLYSNGSVMPDDVVHFLMLHLENATGADRYAEVEHVDYQEVYPD